MRMAFSIPVKHGSLTEATWNRGRDSLLRTLLSPYGAIAIARLHTIWRTLTTAAADKAWRYYKHEKNHHHYSDNLSNRIRPL